MSRRDIIIIAVLLNASLLAVLFFMSGQGDDDKVNDPIEMQQQIVAISELSTSPALSLEKSLPNPKLQPRDEIDDVLKEYAVPSPAASLADDGIDDNDKEEYADLYPEPILLEKERQNDHYLEVTVKRGDALEKIARANGTTVNAIKKLNKLNSEKVFVGQILRIPIEEKKEKIETKIAVKPSVQNTAGEPEYYIIKSGDNPWKIARLYHVKFDELLKLNNLDEEKARNLKIGDKIRVK